jgi:hypothetical protein
MYLITAIRACAMSTERISDKYKLRTIGRVAATPKSH